jgi:ATP-dependent Clp protease ATP-binding subunit ClpA
MTTNIGTKAITKSILENDTIQNVMAVAIRELKAYFPAEFLNRFTALVPYSPLSKDDVFRIAKIKLSELQSKIREKQINMEFSDEVIRQIAEMAYSPEWGAREINRIIEDKVETHIAEKIISGEINSGDTYKFDMIQ